MGGGALEREEKGGGRCYRTAGSGVVGLRLSTPGLHMSTPGGGAGWQKIFSISRDTKRKRPLKDNGVVG